MEAIEIPKDFFSSLKATPNDIIKLEYSDGLFNATIKMDDGTIISKKYYYLYNSNKIINFDLNKIKKNEIIKLVKNLYFKSGFSQNEIAGKIGLSQSTVSNYIRV